MNINLCKIKHFLHFYCLNIKQLPPIINTTNLKRKRKDLTIEEKQKLLKLIDEDKGCSQRFFSSKYNLSLGCINNLMKSRDSILDTNLNMKQKRKWLLS